MPDKDKNKDNNKNKNAGDPNTVLIPREMVERKKLLATTNLTPKPLTPEQAASLHRFDVLPASPISDDEDGRDYHHDDDDDEDDDNDKKKGRHKRRHAKDPSRNRYGSGTCPKCGKSSSQSGKVTVTGENYLHLYMEQQKQTREQQLQMSSNEAAKAEEKKREEQKRLESKRSDEQRIRAHALQDQIAFWKQQKGMGQYDDSTLGGILTPLENELNAIPPIYWK